MVEVVYRPLHTGNKNPWSREDMHYLADNHEEMYIEDIAEKLNRTVTATKGKAHALGCSIKSKPKGIK